MFVVNQDEIRYAGFWCRLGANLIDSVLITLWTFPFLYYFYGDGVWSDPRLIKGPADFVFGWILPTLVVILFWERRQATMGKLLLNARIVDACTYGPPSLRQNAIRYFGCILSILPLGAGFLWIAVDRRKQGLHDKLAGTVVILHEVA